MKAVLRNYKGGKLQVAEVPAPALQPGGVLVRNAASLLSPGTEWLMIELAQKSLAGEAGERPELVRQVVEKIRRDGLLVAYDTVKNRLDTPVPLGYSSAGTVVEVGWDVSGIEAGDRVACAGAEYALHAEVIYVPRNLVVKLPPEVSFEAGAFTTAGTLALQGLRLARPQLGETVAVIGLGLIGLLVVQEARAAGCSVLGIDTDLERCRLARKLGAALAVADEKELQVLCSAQTAGRGVDAVIISASTKSSRPVALAGEVARQRGTVVALGAVGLELSREPYYEKELNFVVSRSYGPGRCDPAYEEKGRDYPVGYVRWTGNRNMEAFVEQLAGGGVVVEPLITHRFPVEEATKAYDRITHETPLGVLFTYAGDDVGTPLARVDYPARASAAPEMTRNPGIGAIGAGQFGSGVLLPALEEVGGIDLRGLCTSSGIKADHLARRFGFRYGTTDPSEILHDTDVRAVVIATRHHDHAWQVLAGLEGGKHVFVEKPLCLTDQDLRRIERAYAELARNGRPPVLMVGYNRRFAPLARRLRAFVQWIGEPLVVNYRVNAGIVPLDHWAHDPEQGGGRLLGDVCHFVDFMVFVTGSLPVRVSAVALPELGPYKEDNLSATIELANGALGNITYVANGASSFPEERVEVFGGGTTAVLDNYRKLELFRDGRREVHRSWLRRDKGHRKEMAVFIEAVRNGGPPPIPSAGLFAVTRSTLALVQSLRERRPVQI